MSWLKRRIERSPGRRLLLAPMDAMEEQAMDMPWNQADRMEQHADSTGHKSKKDKSHKEEQHKKECKSKKDKSHKEKKHKKEKQAIGDSATLRGAPSNARSILLDI